MDGNDWYEYCRSNPLRYYDPDGYNAIDNAGNFAAGLTTAGVENLSWGLLPKYPYEPNSQWYYAGKIVGDLICQMVGSWIFIDGIKNVGANMVVLCLSDGTAILICGPGVALSTAEALYGGGVFVTSINNLKEDVGRYFSSNRSPHAEMRGQQGRPVGPARSDAQKAKVNDIFIQEDNGRWIVKGNNGRIHVFEANGEHVTTFKNPANNVNMRVRQGRWVRPTSLQLERFKAIFHNINI